MESIKLKLSEALAKKILGNRKQAFDYLLRLNKQKKIPDLKFKVISRGPKKGTRVLDIDNQKSLKIIINTWNYETSKKIIRDLFKETDKYKRGKEAIKAMDYLIKEWKSLKLGKIGWPFSQGKFDEFVQRINSEKANGFVKDEKVKIAAVKYRRIKEINTVRSDFIETLIFENNENIVPTLSHRRGIDFFINGVAFDQKVAKSPTDQFKKKFKDNWRENAINNPELVAKYLYKHQDEGRFDADPRLYVVYIDEDVSIQAIKEIIETTNLENPIEVSFTYEHEKVGSKKYKAPYFIILLHN